jgi:cation transport regulator ChaB
LLGDNRPIEKLQTQLPLNIENKIPKMRLQIELKEQFLAELEIRKAKDNKNSGATQKRTAGHKARKRN